MMYFGYQKKYRKREIDPNHGIVEKEKLAAENYSVVSKK